MTDVRETTSAAPTARRSPRRGRRPAFALGAVAAAAAVAVAVPAAGGSHHRQQAAASAPHGTATTGLDIVTTDYTVKSAPNGVVSVRLMNVKGIPGLQAALRKAGVPAAVTGFSASCHTKVAYDNGVDIEKVFPRAADGRETLIRLSAVPRGEHLLFVAITAHNGTVASLQNSVVRRVPGCVPQSDNGIGEG